MKRRNSGFTLIEMLIVMAIFGMVLAGTTQMVVSMLTAQQQQGKIAETNIEGIIGLDLLRQDLGKAGYGLPWNGLINYNEVTGNPYSLNDAGPTAPKGIVSKNDVADVPALIGTDYLVIRAANVATNAACNKWTFLSSTGVPVTWTPASENLSGTDRVIILMPGSLSTEATARTLVTSGGVFSAQFNAIPSSLSSSLTSTGIVYGIDSDSTLARPFNRADYYVSQPAGGMPQRCAPGTGILYKAVLNQSNTSLGAGMPLLDCVADMQVVFRLDRNGNGNITNTSVLTDILGTPLTVAQIRDQVKEVRVYILAHEGQRDVNYSYTFPASSCPANQIYVGGDSTVGNSSGRCFDFSGITDWKNYRWKVYTLVVRLDNLL